MADTLRLDHYLFRARLFKSRSKATDACRSGRILVNDVPSKASSDVRVGDRIKIREKGLYREIVLQVLPGKNMSKADAKETWVDETPQEILDKKELLQLERRIKGPRREGPRPTKKERRELEKVRKKP